MQGVKPIRRTLCECFTNSRSGLESFWGGGVGGLAGPCRSGWGQAFFSGVRIKRRKKASVRKPKIAIWTGTEFEEFDQCQEEAQHEAGDEDKRAGLV